MTKKKAGDAHAGWGFHWSLWFQRGKLARAESAGIICESTCVWEKNR